MRLGEGEFRDEIGDRPLLIVELFPAGRSRTRSLRRQTWRRDLDVIVQVERGEVVGGGRERVRVLRRRRWALELSLDSQFTLQHTHVITTKRRAAWRRWAPPRQPSMQRKKRASS